jgi:hypothetical protein
VEKNENTDSPRESVSSVGFFYARKRADVANKLGISRHDIGRAGTLQITWADYGTTSDNIVCCKPRACIRRQHQPTFHVENNKDSGG